MAKSRGAKRRLGDRLVSEFAELRDVLRSNKPVERRYTVRTVELDLKPRPFGAEAVRCIRLSLRVSQAVFAEIIGVSPDLVAAWEQGHRKSQPSRARNSVGFSHRPAIARKT
jgi:putative transcriptional regulator